MIEYDIAKKFQIVGEVASIVPHGVARLALIALIAYLIIKAIIG